jgi:hypothetical protein
VDAYETFDTFDVLIAAALSKRSGKLFDAFHGHPAAVGIKNNKFVPITPTPLFAGSIFWAAGTSGVFR